MEENSNSHLTYPTYPTTSSCEAACTSVVSFCVQEINTDPLLEEIFVCQLNSVLFALVISAAVAIGIVIPLSFVLLYVIGCFSSSRRSSWRGASEEMKAINTNTKIQVPSDSDSFPIKKCSMMVGDGRQKQLQWHESVSMS
ncbi:hypothetical protein PRIPAC_71633 [Pristionchus pacificus]|uniref:Uncharacterized protein n=1 Tax=Pristionchus pacificus TaxID=54126 RepID=A0A2A6CA46_PRIPA|nr:hypothetical protein PRIPAC_71633 [Pristionchus pacificus]|eukprot:PDM74966.1 hypothetical protein PRIPAC_40347 [Pristionchus pacificus]